MSYLDLARGRYSCREFQDRSVEQAVVDAIVEAGRIAPSACNNHPSRVMVLDTPELLEKAAACQPRFARDGSIFGAPLIFLICSVTDDAWVRPYDQMNSSEIDTSIVCDQMMMEATEQGLGQTSQNSAVLRLKDRPPPGIVACESLERSHPRNSSSLVAVSSYLTVVDAPQAVHLHRWDPDEVLPLRLVRPPQ